MKIAMCFSGQLRNVRSTFNNWYHRNVFEPNQHHDIDVFVHTWYDNTTAGNVYYASNEIPNSVIACDTISEHAIQEVYSLYNPVEVHLERPKIFDEKNYNSRRLEGAIPQNGISRAYSINKCATLKRAYEQANNFTYDVVAVARFDFIFNQPFTFDMVTTTNTVYHPGHSPHGFNVCYAMGDSRTMDIYCDLYHNIDAVFNSGIYWCDENLARRFIEMTGMSIHDFNIHNGINRGGI